MEHSQANCKLCTLKLQKKKKKEKITFVRKLTNYGWEYVKNVQIDNEKLSEQI